MLIDTSGFFCLHDASEEHHSEANRFNQLSRIKITTSYVLAEYVALAIVRGLPRGVVTEFSFEILADDSVEIVWVDKALHSRSVDLLLSRSDKTYSLCDAVSFVLMRDRGITEALTTTSILSRRVLRAC